jgi:hypothetical protein
MELANHSYYFEEEMKKKHIDKKIKFRYYIESPLSTGWQELEMNRDE